MYGLIIEGLHYMIREHFGDQVHVECVRKAMLQDIVLSSHEVYSEKIAPNMLAATAEVTESSFQDIGILAGRYFVHFAASYGYDALLKVSGRRFGDFLKGLDNMHEFFKFSYPKIRPPSFYCEKEDKRGVLLHYRSRRSGYITYVMGQLMEIAKIFYNLAIEVRITKREEKRGIAYSVLRLNFDNKNYKDDRQLREQILQLSTHLSVDAVGFLDMFPFYIVFSKSFLIELTGKAIHKMMPDLIGRKLNEEFNLLIPLVKFTYEAVRAHLTSIFKMESYRCIKRRKAGATMTIKLDDMLVDKVELAEEQKKKEETPPAQGGSNGTPVPGSHGTPDDPNMLDGEDEEGYPMRLRGQMLYVKRSEVFVFLATCEVDTLDQMYNSGICVSDYSIADCNRDMIMVTVQQSDDLKNLLAAEQEKSVILKENMKELDKARSETKELLSQMMPKSVAGQLVSSSGLEPPNIVQSFEDSTVCFTKIKDFPVFTEKLSVMAIVNLLNQIYNLFDKVVERHGVYKKLQKARAKGPLQVETIGESYMISGGVPHETPYHTEYAADCGLDMLAVMNNFQEETTGDIVKVKQGMHSGPVVGGIVGFKAPRYCLIGDAVNTASRMESHNSVVKTLMASGASKERLERMNPDAFRFISRGQIEVKGKGAMETFEIVSKSGEARCDIMPIADDDDESVQIYTPQDMLEDQRSSAVSSRMSVSRDIIHSGSTSRASPSSRMSSRQSGSNSVIDQALQDLEAHKLTDIKEETVISSASAVDVKVKGTIHGKPAAIASTLRGVPKIDDDDDDSNTPPPMPPGMPAVIKPKIPDNPLQPKTEQTQPKQESAVPPPRLGKGTPPPVPAPALGASGPLMGKLNAAAAAMPPERLGARNTPPPAPAPEPKAPPSALPHAALPEPAGGKSLAEVAPSPKENAPPPRPKPEPEKEPKPQLISRDSVERLFQKTQTPPFEPMESNTPGSRKASLESVDLTKAGVQSRVLARGVDPSPSESMAQLQRATSQTPPNMPPPKPPTPPSRGPTIASLGTTALAPPPAGSRNKFQEKPPKPLDTIQETTGTTSGPALPTTKSALEEPVPMLPEVDDPAPPKNEVKVVEDENPPVLVVRKNCMCGIHGSTVETDVCAIL